MDPALLSSASALLGALVGGGTSLAVAIYTQRYQDRLQRISKEIAKREAVYTEFITVATNLLLNAYMEDKNRIALHGDEQRLIGLIDRMRLFAPKEVITEAEAALKAIIEILLKPPVALGELAKQALSSNPEPDPFLRFCRSCRADLENVHRILP